MHRGFKFFTRYAEGETRYVFSSPSVLTRSIPCFMTMCISLILPVDSRVDSKTFPLLKLSLKAFRCHKVSFFCAIIAGIAVTQLTLRCIIKGLFL